MSIPYTNQYKFENQLTRAYFHYEDFEILKDEIMQIYIFNNVNIRPQFKDKQIRLTGEWSVVFNAGGHFGHYIKEYAGGFTFLKSKLPNLQPLFLDRKELEESGIKRFQSVLPVIEEVNAFLHAKYGGMYINQTDFYNSNLIIDKLVVVMDNGRNIFHRQYPFFWEVGASEISQEMIKAFGDLLVDDPSKPKRIYISRKSMSQALNADKDNISKHYQSRNFEEWVENGIEQAFIDKGYTIIDFYGMSFKEQVSYAHNTDYFASITGSAFHNGIWVKPGTTFYAIQPNDLYNHDWGVDIIKSVENISWNYIKLNQLKSYDEIYNHMINIIN